MQPRFIFSCVLGGLLMALVLAFACWLRGRPNVEPVPPRIVAMSIQPVALGHFPAPARLVGAWTLEAPDARFGGLSGLALEGGRLVAITEGGTALWLAPPTSPSPRVLLMDLPVVAGDPRRKAGRDSEALLAAPGGGWWVAFEQRHMLIRYDSGFDHALERVALRGRIRPNRGVEALARGRDGRLIALPESSGASDAARLADGRLLLVERRISPFGLTSRLVAPGLSLPLPLGPLDNPEGVAAAPLPGGGTRLWIVSDNDFSPRRRTLLILVDLPANPTTR